MFCFYKNWKSSKTVCPVLATQSRVSQVACHSRDIAGQFWRLVREWKVQSRGIHRDFRGLARDSLASETSSRKKHLENFSKLLVWSVLAGVTGDYLATFLSHEKRVFCIVRAVFKIFFSFSLKLFVTVHFLFHLKLPKHSVSPPSNSIVASFFSKSSRKCMGFLFIFYVLSIIFLPFWVVIVFRVILCSISLLLECWVWLVLFDADFIWCHIVGHIVLIFVLYFGVCWVFILIWKMGLVLFLCFTPFMSMRV